MNRHAIALPLLVFLAACADGTVQPSGDTWTSDAIDSVDAADSTDPGVDTGGCSPEGCPPGTECVDGLCRKICTTTADCPGVLECCDGHCYNTASEPYHCGECGNRCLPEGNACLSGVCSCNGASPCDPGITCCATGGCIDTTWDRNNCGDCGVVCPPDVHCIGGECGGCCADHGCPEVPHGTTACDGCDCIITGCEDGWIDGDGAFENGCECAADVVDNGGETCLDAYFMGEISDEPSSSVTVQGYISTFEPEDWYYFTATDTADDTCDAFHVVMTFIDNPGDVHQFDVFLGACSGTVECEDDTEFEVDLNFSTEIGGELFGECPCVASDPGHGENLCSDNTATYYFVVHLAEGATPSGCENYTVSVSNGA